MREVGASPFSIKSSYKNRNIKPDYNYTLEKTKDPKTLIKVIDAIEKNYNTILDINQTTDIYTLGAYVPKSLENDEMNIFRELVIAYNEKLLELCKQYGITFVNTAVIGKKYNKSKSDFHIAKEGYNALADTILDCIYKSKFETEKTYNRTTNNSTKILNKGAEGVIKFLNHDYENIFDQAIDSDGYDKKRYLDIYEEHKREIKIFQKVLDKKTY